MSTVTLNAPEVRTTSGLHLVEMETSTSGRFLEGRAVPYNTWANIGWFMEQHEAGSFTKSISESAAGLPLLIFHNNRTWPIGVTDEWRDNDDALDVVWRMDTSEEAERALDLAEKGMLTGLSIGFAPIRSAWDYVDFKDWDPDKGPDFMDKVTRQESRLLEVSLTPTPAFAGAQVSLVRSREPKKLRERQTNEVESWRSYLSEIKR